MHVTRQPCCDFSARGAARCGAVRCGAVRCGATTGCALFPASVLCFPAVDPLHRQSTHVHAHIQTRTPLHPVDRPAALLSPVERIRRRAFFEYSMPPPPSFSLSFSPLLSPFFVLFLSGFAMTESIGFRYNFLDVTRLFTRTDQFSAKNASLANSRCAIRVKSRGRAVRDMLDP